MKEVVVYPHPILRTSCVEVKPGPRIDALIDEMFAVMYEHKGIGLAANQLGYPWRVLVMNISGDPKEKSTEIALLNPEVLRRGNRWALGEEGCLSLPDLRIQIDRPHTVLVRGLCRNGKTLTTQLAGLAGRCIQHEIDHLDGMLITDYPHASKKDEVAVAECMNRLTTEAANKYGPLWFDVAEKQVESMIAKGAPDA